MLITLARKPIDPRLGTVVASCLDSGLGAINIGASRIGTGTGEVTTVQVPDHRGGNYGQDLAAYSARPMLTVQRIDQGRWPANLLLAHLPGCQHLGLARVKSNGHYPAVRGTGGLGTSGHTGQDALVERHTDGEAVAAWSCVDGCPVAALDGQSGNTPIRGNVSQSTSGGGGGTVVFTGRTLDAHHLRPELKIVGGASKFFRQITPGTDQQTRTTA